MKKQTIITTVIIDSLILVLFLLGTGIYTYLRATNEMQSLYQKAANYDVLFGLSQSDLADISDRSLIIHTFSNAWGKNGSAYRPEDTGYYGFIELPDGTMLDTSSDYCVLQIAADNDHDETMVTDGTVNSHDLFIRIFALKDGYDFDTSLYGVTFDGECDDIFIHNGTMTYLDNTYELKDFGYSSSERIPYASLFEKDGWSTCVDIVKCARNEYEKELNAEARERCDNLYNDIKQSHFYNLEDLQFEDIITSQYMSLRSSQNGIMIGSIYVFHPLEIVLRSNIALYIILFAVLLLTEGFVVFMMRKTYLTKQEQEMRSRRLRKGIAHELKTPLAIARMFMENQEYIDEKDRPEYSRKVNLELDNMADLINSLLEMDKIDSGEAVLHPEEFDINAMIKSVYAHIKPLADERKLEVNLPSDKEYLIKADIKFMRIAIGNYLTNMVKYADKKADVKISMHGNAVKVAFVNDSSNDKKNGIDKLNSNGMGVEINENIMRLHGFKYGSGMYYSETTFWFEAEKI